MRRLPLAFLLLISGGAAAGSWQILMSPGPLGAAHEPTEANCDACHLPFDGIPDEKCLACHEDVGQRIASAEGFHASVGDQLCVDCHTDHLGPDASLTKEAAAKAFDHASTGFPLTGTHGVVECTRCHTGNLADMDASCGACHDQDPHQSALGTSCETCHQPSGWNEDLKALASHQVAMTGGHQGLGCADCHLHGDHLSSQTGCQDCHRQAHDGTKSPCGDCHQVSGWKPAEFDHGPCTCSFAGKHQTAACLDCHPAFDFSDTPTLCSGCHTKDRPHENLGECSTCHTSTSFRIDRFEHNKRTKFVLAGEHLRVDCAGCHPTAGTFRGAAKTCEGCHAAQGEAAHGDFGACSTCHTTDGFVPSSFDHATTGFVLEGRHDALGCPACHREKVPR
jgi:hypothetical protein